jgi:hypothetical protein
MYPFTYKMVVVISQETMQRIGMALGVVCKASEIGQQQLAYQSPGKIIVRRV